MLPIHQLGRAAQRASISQAQQVEGAGVATALIVTARADKQLRMAVPVDVGQSGDATRVPNVIAEGGRDAERCAVVQRMTLDGAIYLQQEDIHGAVEPRLEGRTDGELG